MDAQDLQQAAERLQAASQQYMRAVEQAIADPREFLQSCLAEELSDTNRSHVCILEQAHMQMEQPDTGPGGSSRPTFTHNQQRYILMRVVSPKLSTDIVFLRLHRGINVLQALQGMVREYARGLPVDSAVITAPYVYVSTQGFVLEMFLWGYAGIPVSEDADVTGILPVFRDVADLRAVPVATLAQLMMEPEPDIMRPYAG